MVIHNVVNKLFSAPSSISILRELSKRNVGLSGRELARAAGITPQSAHNALANLEALKIVRREYVGRSHYFILNKKHFLYTAIVQTIFESEREFKSSLFNKIKKELSVSTESVLVFGSTARNEEGPESDLDICIIYKTGKHEIEKIVSDLRNSLYETYGVTLAPFYITSADFIKKAKMNKPPVNDIVSQGMIISGKSIQRLLNG